MFQMDEYGSHIDILDQTCAQMQCILKCMKLETIYKPATPLS